MKKWFLIFLGWLIMSALSVWLMAMLSEDFTFPPAMPVGLVIFFIVFVAILVAGTAECWRIIRDPLMKN